MFLTRSILQVAMTLPPARARIMLKALVAREASQPEAETLEEWTRQAAEAFERDMQPVRAAIVDALNAGDINALRGLRAMLPSLLDEVTADPTLADLLAYQLGKTFLDGFQEERERQESETEESK